MKLGECPAACGGDYLLRAAIWSSGKRIESEDIRAALIPSVQPRNTEILDQPLGNGFSLKKLLDEVAQHYLKRALKHTHGNKSKAAELVGLPNYQTLSNWMAKYSVRDGS